MSSINGLAVLKNSFSWKFSKYPRFHKKVKLQIQEKGGGAKKNRLCENAYTVVGVGGPPEIPGPLDSCLSPCWQFGADPERTPSTNDLAHDHTDYSTIDHTDYSTIDYSSLSFGSDGPLYENTVGYIEPSSSILLSYTSEDDVDEHIYDFVSNSVEERPGNIFLSLVEGEGITISPDPNIYEVPPGAIFNTESHLEEYFPLINISPPNGFRDKLTWERLHLVTDNGEDNGEALYSLPIKLNLDGSAIVRPKRKKIRPGIEELLNQKTNMKDSMMQEEQADSKNKENDTSSRQEPTNYESLKIEPPIPEDIDNTLESCVSAVSNCSNSSNEVCIDSIVEVVPKNLTVLEANVEGLLVELNPPNHQLCEPSEQIGQKDFTSIIEISGDGTWNTVKIPATHVESSKNNETNVDTSGCEQDFLSASADARAKHVNLAYSGQYYTSNCPVASIKPMKHDDDAVLDTKKNIGAQIMEKYEEERKKIIEIKNLPDISLLDIEESVEEIQKERRKVIESQAVRAKRIDSWIKGRSVSLNEDGSMPKVEQEGEEDEPTSQSSLTSDSLNMYLDENGEVVYDSIIQNKSKIKSYWEQLMLAAELASHSAPAKTPATGHTFQHQYSTGHLPSHINNITSQSNNHVNTHSTPQAPPHQHVAHHAVSPDLSDTEYYDALSHVSPQTPDPAEKDWQKLNETVVERDIRLQQERELALMIERQKAIKSAKEKARLREKEEEAYLSIPTTDEGNFSEYGSEDKEDHSPDDSRVTSPVVPVDISSHHRTQSLDSMSSGHSSGSGTDLSMTKIEQKPAQKPTFGPVKPLDEPEDVDIIRYAKNSLKHQTDSDDKVGSLECGYEKETPIEREIRLAREREEELRREKRISVTPLAASVPLKSDTEKKRDGVLNVTNQRVTPATQRVQQEIELATEREKELKRWNSDDLQKDMSIKVVLKPTSKKTKSPQSLQPPVVQNGDVKKELADTQIPKSPNFVKNGGASPKLYIPNPQQKGLMKRFLASRGKMGSTPRLNTLTSPKSPSATTLPSLSPTSLLAEPFFTFTSQVQTKEREEPANLGARPGYKSAEDKIQSELQEMKRREEELRQQRRSNLYSARSQPDLLNIGCEAEGGSDRETEGEMTRLPNTSKLRSALSVQNLLDVDEKPAPRRVPKRRSALIEQWENRIQNKN